MTDLNTSFSSSFETILLSDNFFSDYMNNIERISTIDQTKFINVFRRIDPQIGYEIRKKLVDLCVTKFELGMFTLKKIDMNSIPKDIYYATIAYVENRTTDQLDNLFEHLKFAPSRYLQINKENEEACLGNNMEFQGTPNDEDNLIKSDLLYANQQLLILKEEIKILKIDRDAMRNTMNALVSSNENLLRKVNFLCEKVPRTPLSAYPAMTANNFDLKFPPIGKKSVINPVITNVIDRVPATSTRNYSAAVTSTNKNIIPVEKKKATKIIGSGASSDGFTVVETKRYFPVYMGRVDKTTTIEVVKTYLATKDIGVYDIVPLDTKRHDRFLAFRFKIPYENKDKIYDATLWPKGLLLRKFLQPRNGHSNVAGAILGTIPIVVEHIEIDHTSN